MKFKVGDKITGLDKIPYGITTKDAIMKIVRILPDNEIKVKIIQHKSKYASQIGKIFQVDVKHFKKVKEPLMKFKTFKTMNTKNPIYWECIKGKHKKFWAAKIIIEADVPTSTSGKSVTQKYVLFRKWGRIGNASQTMKNEFDDLYTAEQELEKLIRDKEYKGYKPIF